MKLEGPEHFRVMINDLSDPGSFQIEDAGGSSKFSGRATSKLPKLYIVTADSKPIYVGITTRSMRARLRHGWQAKGESGYYGYSWRHHHREVGLDVWYQVDPSTKTLALDVETIEAEVVFLIRQAGQWPAYQTEIHFHESSAAHREVAFMIWSHYRTRDR